MEPKEEQPPLENEHFNTNIYNGEFIMKNLNAITSNCSPFVIHLVPFHYYTIINSNRSELCQEMKLICKKRPFHYE